MTIDNRSINISEFNYTLPEGSIAKYPLKERDSSKLLMWNRGEVSHNKFRDLASLIPSNSLLIFNNSRVIRARLHFQKSTGAKIEIFCLEPQAPHDYALSFASTTECSWFVTIGNAKKWKTGKLELPLTIDNKPVMLYAEQVDITETPDSRVVKFSWNNSDYSFSEILEASGNIPIPPYLNRDSEESDLTCYQTVYSKIKGSVAAPTAGLHFTESIFNQLKERGVKREELTLHVGAGTFRPVKSETIGEHSMHSEHISVNRRSLISILDNLDSIIAVGTTSIRTVESLYWMGVKVVHNSNISIEELFIDQWYPYNEIDIEKNISAKESITALLNYMDSREIDQLENSTQIIITPGYRYRVIRGMITNFHQPQSTLLLLIAALLGDDWREIYQEAIDRGYRFLSYGDSNLYLK